MNNSLNAKLASLGVAFLIEPIYAADPELTILEAVRRSAEERKLLSLVLGWIALYGNLLNIGRLRVLARTLNAEELAWLGGLASTAAEDDRRWRVIVQFIEGKLGLKEKRFSTSKLDSLAAKRKGADPHFARFGLILPSMEPAPEKKFLQRQEIFKRNPWLRVRALFGANWRADIAWQMMQDETQTPYRVAKVLGCNIETAYRNWAALREVGLVELIALPGE